MSTISAMGVGSGIDIRGLVDQLVAAERKPREMQIQRSETRIKEQMSGLGRLKSALATFGDAASKLNQASTFRQINTRVTNEGVVSATGTSTAPQGNYDVNVINLAQAQRMVTRSDMFSGVTDFSASGTALGSGEMIFSFDGGGSETISIANGSPSSLNDWAAAINSQSSRLTASVVDDGSGPRMILTSAQTGEANAVTGIAVNNAGGGLIENFAADMSGVAQTETNGGFTLLRQAQDARVEIDGMAVTRSTNEITNAIDGVTLTLSSVGESRVIVDEKQGAARTAVEDFVKAYNTLLEEFSRLGAFDKDSNTAGLLNGDATLRSAQTQLYRIIGDPVGPTDSPVRILADMGIGTEKDGTLKIDETRLTQRLSEDREALVSFFTDDEHGLAKRLGDFVNNFTGNDSPINSRNDSLQKQLKGIEDQRERMDYSMERLEARLISQFSAMDAMVAQMNQTSDFLSNQMSLMQANTRASRR
ncbi:flagellar filament capping protein FliD [Ectothiorhodospira lacustris]|uniref:flagellar filament capping protein FliD n=1 Tax=Ectothiorhodospira lacustris TaxID=2899127 RepID=UPI001EE9530F|nr:flagellar filament capping protein FliD [Ectothiorhodospira lacustris]MCG5501473.1 flagellar filament capping protein FliD [Ectothiorhodospira lacustris]